MTKPAALLTASSTSAMLHYEGKSFWVGMLMMLCSLENTRRLHYCWYSTDATSNVLSCQYSYALRCSV